MEIKGNYILVEGYGTLLIPAKHMNLLEHCAMVRRPYRDGKHVLEWAHEEMSFKVIPEREVRAAYAASQLEEPK
jgi:hypothetical protein